MEPWGGSVLKWTEDKVEDQGATVWNVVEQLKAGGVELHKGPEYHENESFLWIMDPDGNKVELWEPKIWDDKNKK